MDERITGFLDLLKENLGDLPEDEAKDALGYYEGFLCDAQDEGKDVGQVIAQLDKPEKIAAVIKAGTAIRRAEDNPGFMNFKRAMKTARAGIKAPFSVFFISLFIIISYCVVVTLFAGAFAFLLGAVVTAMAAFYEASKIPFSFFPEMLGTIGTGLFSGGICLIISLCFYRLAKVFIRLSARLVRRTFMRNSQPSGYKEIQGENKPKKGKRLVLAFSITALIGLVLFSVSGLPYKFFTIFNSMKPDKITLVTHDIDTAGINKISIASAHSCIEIGYQDTDTDKITVSYEQPDWLTYDLSTGGGMLSFHENSNGRLPFFSIDTLHESRTEIKVLLPRGYSPDIIELESRGGFITLNGLKENIIAKTYTGKINLVTQGVNVNLEAVTEVGWIEADGKTLGNKTQNGMEYYRHVDSDKTIELTSSRGDINIQ